MNIGLMFVHEKFRYRKLTKRKWWINSNKIGSKNFITNIAWISGTLGGPVISFFKKNGFSIALGILGFVFYLKIGEAFLRSYVYSFL